MNVASSRRQGGAAPREVGEVSRARQGLNPMALWSVRPPILFPAAGQDLIDNFEPERWLPQPHISLQAEQTSWVCVC